MKNKIIKMLLLSCVLSSNAIVAQDTPEQVKPIEKTVAIPKAIKEKKNSIVVYGGLPGIAIGYGRKLNEHFTARIDYGSLAISQNIDNLTFSNRKVNAAVNYDFQAVDLFLEMLPSKQSSLKFVVGASYLSKMDTSILIAAASGDKFGDITITAEQIGDIFVDAKWSGISPYFAMGFGRTVPKHNFGFGFEVGGRFLGKPDFIFNATKSLVPLVETEKENKEFQNFIEGIKILPTIQIHLAYKF